MERGESVRERERGGGEKGVKEERQRGQGGDRH